MADDRIFVWGFVIIFLVIPTIVMFYLMLRIKKELNECIVIHFENKRDKARSECLYKKIGDDFDAEIIRLQQEILERNKIK